MSSTQRDQVVSSWSGPLTGTVGGALRHAPPGLAGGLQFAPAPPTTQKCPTGARMASVTSIPLGGRAGRAVTPSDSLAALHREHYRSLVRLAYVVLGDTGAAEQIVQDAFVRLQLRWGGLRDRDRAPAYLRSAVLNGARSHLRHVKVRDRFAGRRTVARTGRSPESAALEHDGHDRMITALRGLSDRQREALVLRYYLDLPEAEIAATMGVSAGSVKTHLHRGLANLAEVLPEEDR